MARRKLRVIHQRDQQVYYARRCPVPFKIADKVYLKDHPLRKAVNKFSAKLANSYKGTYIIKTFYSAVIVGLKDDSRRAARANVS